MATEELAKHEMCQVFSVLHFTCLQNEGKDTNLQIGHDVMCPGKATLTHICTHMSENTRETGLHAPEIQRKLELQCQEALGVLLTTVCLVGVVAAVIHPVTLPHQADAHPVLALEAELVAGPVELGVLGCRERFGIKIKGHGEVWCKDQGPQESLSRKEHAQGRSQISEKSIAV